MRAAAPVLAAVALVASAFAGGAPRDDGDVPDDAAARALARIRTPLGWTLSVAAVPVGDRICSFATCTGYGRYYVAPAGADPEALARAVRAAGIAAGPAGPCDDGCDPRSAGPYDIARPRHVLGLAGDDVMGWVQTGTRADGRPGAEVVLIRR